VNEQGTTVAPSVAPSVAVGVDGSDAALRAVRWAAAEARRRRAPLRILHAAPYAVDNLPGERRAASILALAYVVADHAQPQVSTHTEWFPERPARVLAAAAETAQLLVVGMGGGNGVDDVLRHSTALEVSAVAACPVVVVRDYPGPVPADGTVVLGVDDIGADAAAVTAAFGDAERTASRLVALHALRGPRLGARRAGRAPGRRPSGGGADAHAGVLALAVPLPRCAGGRAGGARRPGGAPPGGGDGRAAGGRRHTRPRPGARLVLGSTSRAVARRCPCPVMIVCPGVHVVEPEPERRAQPAAADAPGEARTSTTRGPHLRDRSELW
jgi:nucleotide-binding universal stress UspA family protein